MMIQGLSFSENSKSLKIILAKIFTVLVVGNLKHFCKFQLYLPSYTKLDRFSHIVLLSLNIILILANSVDPDEMPHYVAFIWVFTVYQNMLLHARRN